jgi:long-chain acyl-CoA synthetase
MGNSTTALKYSAECSEKKDGETTVRRGTNTLQGLKSVPSNGVLTLQDAWLTSLKVNGPRSCLFSKNSSNVYVGKTYDEVNGIAKALGSAIVKKNLTSLGNEDPRFKDLKLIGIFARNVEEWAILDISNLLYLFYLNLVY